MSWEHDHTHFKCSDYEKTVSFFQDNFGAREISRVEVSGTAIVTLSIGGLVCNFSPKKPGETVDPRTEPLRYGVYHIAFKTRNLNAEVARMKARGVRFTQDVTQVNPSTRCAFVEAPDGISVELLQRD